MSSLKKNVQIEVLRGLSILFVFFFHLKTPYFQNGFLGVDVFFVISGFLMALIYSDMSSRENVLRFYKRRLDRLLPAYFLVLFITIVVSAYLTLPYEFKDVIRHGRWSAFLMPNVGFWMDNSYFNAQQFKPFLNFWSLGIEIQFYLVFPLLIWIYNKNKAALYILGVLSFIGYVGMDFISPKTSFFMMPLRIWQFVIGFYAAQLVSRELMQHRGIGLIGLLALFVTLFAVPDVNTLLPLWGLAICAFTGVVIVGGLPARILRSYPSRFFEILGKYSYSIYLVHFPVIAFMNYTAFNGLKGKPETLLEIVTIFAVTGILSVASYHLVEHRLRHRATTGQKRNLSYALIIAVTLLAMPLLKSQNIDRFGAEEKQILSAWFDRDAYRCGKIKRLLDPFSNSCLLTNPPQENGKTVLLVGSSHADSIKQALGDVAQENGHALRLMKLNTSLGQGYSPQDVKDEVIRNNIDIVVLHNPLSRVYQDKYDLVEPITELVRLSEESDSPFEIVWVDPVPIYQNHIPKTFFRASRGEKEAQAVLDKPQGINQYRKDLSSYDEQLKSISSPLFKRYKVEKIFCTPVCALREEKGELLYFDTNHLTLTGSQRLKPVFEKFLRK